MPAGGFAGGITGLPRALDVALDDVRGAGFDALRIFLRWDKIETVEGAPDWCTTGQPAGNGPILGCEPNARALRFGLERSYRALARLTPDEDRRIELVDLANAIRPRTLT